MKIMPSAMPNRAMRGLVRVVIWHFSLQKIFVGSERMREGNGCVIIRSDEIAKNFARHAKGRRSAPAGWIFRGRVTRFTIGYGSKRLENRLAPWRGSDERTVVLADQGPSKAAGRRKKKSPGPSAGRRTWAITSSRNS